MQNICQCLKLKAAGGMSDLEHVTPSSAPRVFISLGPVYIKCHKLYVPFPAEDLRQTNGRSSLQKQTHSACWRRDKKKKKRGREVQYVLTNSRYSWMLPGSLCLRGKGRDGHFPTPHRRPLQRPGREQVPVLTRTPLCSACRPGPSGRALCSCVQGSPLNVSRASGGQI